MGCHTFGWGCPQALPVRKDTLWATAVHEIEASLRRSASGTINKAVDKSLGERLGSGDAEEELRGGAMHPFLSPRLAVFIAIVSVMIWSAFALLVAVRAAQFESVTHSSRRPAIDVNAPVISRRLPMPCRSPPRRATACRGRRLLSPNQRSSRPSRSTTRRPRLRPRKVRRAHAEQSLPAPRHAQSSWTKDGKSWRLPAMTAPSSVCAR